MSVNSKPPAPTVEQWLAAATAQLKEAGIPSARLDSEIILAHGLGKSRTWLITHFDEAITNLLSLEGLTTTKTSVLEYIDTLVSKRIARVPLAYLVGHKEFYGRDFIVTPDVLIPRPESEMIIHVLKDLWVNPTQQGQLIDVGTGSGCLGITAALEIPGLTLQLCDVSENALRVAKRNATKWNVSSVRYHVSDLLEYRAHHHKKADVDIILANLPYVNPAWERSPETEHEPALALFADDNGMDLIKRLITQAEKVLVPGGYLLLEADPEQHYPIIDYAVTHQFTHLRTDDYVVTLQR